ncbi:MAG: hypothetical protein IH888_08485, partial [Planctomycetes bacterium]|nr:hypothetical protein [Planctomycetota bacterium]
MTIRNGGPDAAQLKQLIKGELGDTLGRGAPTGMASNSCGGRIMRAGRLTVISVLPWLFLMMQGRSVAEAGPPSDETIQAKVEARERWLAERQGQDVVWEEYFAFLERTLADTDVDELTARQLALLVPLIWDLDAYARPAVRRLQELAKDDGADGAVAAVALFQLNSRYRVLDLEATLKQALTHPGLGKAFERGEASALLSYMHVLPEETLRELKGEVLGVAPLLDKELSADFVPYTVSYFTAVAKMSDAAAQDVRERIRTRVVQLC